MHEDILLERFKRGDDSAFIEIYNLYFHEIYNFVCYSVHRDASEDLSQEIFIKVYRNMEKFKGNSSIKTWIFNIARRTVYDWYRAKKSILNIDDFSNTLTSKNTPEGVVEDNEKMEQLIMGLKKLKEEHRSVILLRKFHGFSIKETAEIMGYSEGKVKTISHRAIKDLKEGLASDYFKKEVHG